MVLKIIWQPYLLRSYSFVMKYQVPKFIILVLDFVQ